MGHFSPREEMCSGGLKKYLLENFMQRGRTSSFCRDGVIGPVDGDGVKRNGEGKMWLTEGKRDHVF